MNRQERQERQEKTSRKCPLPQHFLGALGVLGGKKCDFAVLLVGHSVPFTRGKKLATDEPSAARGRNQTKKSLTETRRHRGTGLVSP